MSWVVQGHYEVHWSPGQTGVQGCSLVSRCILGCPVMRCPGSKRIPGVSSVSMKSGMSMKSTGLWVKWSPEVSSSIQLYLDVSWGVQGQYGVQQGFR